MDDSASNEGTLCVTAKQGEWVRIGTNVRISWYRCERTAAVRFRIKAPREIPINRENRLVADSTTRGTTHEQGGLSR